MFNYAKPQQVGVSSKHIKKYISVLEKYGLSTHNVIMARGNNIFFEKYWEPFDADFKHRMYSVTKSFVSIAIGFLMQDGKLSIDDRIVDYFPDKITGELIPHVKRQTIRDMLMMSNGYIDSRGEWFVKKPDDRLKFYFDESVEPPILGKEVSAIPGMFFEYDTNGSFVLCALVERLSGKTLLEYLKEKLFDKIGVSKDIKCLKSTGGHSWGDSALICKPIDLLKTARFVLNYGKVGDEQILSEEYLKEATSKQIDNSKDGLVAYNTFGYGYQFWRTWEDSFFFNGMGCQLAICVPHKDMILVYNGDNQGNDGAKSVIIDTFFEEIVDKAEDFCIEEDSAFEEELDAYCKGLTLQYAKGEVTSNTAKEVNGVLYKLNENPMGMTDIKLTFNGDEGVFEYTNAQGKKSLKFGLGKNVYGDFPQEGYSDEMGSVVALGHYYRCAASAAWTEESKLGIMVQAIDEYFGRLYISIKFNDDEVAVMCSKTAENFFNEYQGYAEGIKLQ